MAISNIVGQSGDLQDFIVEIPTGNISYVPSDTLIDSDESLLCSEIPAATGGGNNVFIMSE